MNLKNFNGRVPLMTGDPNNPVKVVDFPSDEVLLGLYGNRVKAENKDRYMRILKLRAGGATLNETAREFEITRERVRQIEAKFIRLLQRHYSSSASA